MAKQMSPKAKVKVVGAELSNLDRLNEQQADQLLELFKETHPDALNERELKTRQTDMMTHLNENGDQSDGGVKAAASNTNDSKTT